MRTTLVSALELALVFASACGCGGSGGSGGTPGLNPPQVFLTSASANVVGSSLALTLNVVGCDQVQRLALFDREVLLKEVSPGPLPLSVTLASSELGARYPALGIAADLALVARARCLDGRENDSSTAAVRFFPVARALSDPGGRQLLPNAFIAEGGLSPTPTTFIGCAATERGQVLVRVDTSGAIVKQSEPLPFACGDDARFTEKNLATGRRWLWRPHVGALAFDSSFSVSASFTGDVLELGLAPDGDAVIIEKQRGVLRLSHDQSVVRWTGTMPGEVIRGPTVRSALNRVQLPMLIDEFGMNNAEIWVLSYDYESGLVASQQKLASFPYEFRVDRYVAPVALSDDASVLFVSAPPVGASSSDASLVSACALDLATECQGSALRWRSEAVAGRVRYLLPFAAGRFIAAIADQRVWLLDAATGLVVNREQPVIPRGSLVAQGVEPGRNTELFFLAGAPGGYPVELVALEAPHLPEVFRYAMEGGGGFSTSLTMAVDDGGKPWLRIGGSLVEPLPLSDYRAARQPR